MQGKGFSPMESSELDLTTAHQVTPQQVIDHKMLLIEKLSWAYLKQVRIKACSLA